MLAAMMAMAAGAMAVGATPASGPTGFVVCQGAPGNPQAARASFHDVVAATRADVPSRADAYAAWLKEEPLASRALGANGTDPRIARLAVSCEWFADEAAAAAAIKAGQDRMRAAGFVPLRTRWIPSTDATTAGYAGCTAVDATRKLYFGNVFKTTRGGVAGLVTAYPAWLRTNGPTAAVVRDSSVAALTTTCEFWEGQSGVGSRYMQARSERSREGYTITPTYWSGLTTP